MSQLDGGFIKLYRNILNWEWYDDPNTFKLFIHLLLTVNYYDAKWHGIEVKRGSRIASLKTLSDETKLSIKSVRTALKHLTSAQCVAQYPTSKYTVFTVLNYDLYQERARTKANEGHSKGTVGATNKER